MRRLRLRVRGREVPCGGVAGSTVLGAVVVEIETVVAVLASEAKLSLEQTDDGELSTELRMVCGDGVAGGESG